MGVIFDFLQGIGDVLVSLWEFIIGRIEHVAQIVAYLIDLQANIADYFGWLPIGLVGLLGILLGLVIVFRIMSFF